MLVQSVLFFILGIAATSLLLILVAPVIWRRALYIARRVISTEVPISLTEVQADRDFLRARHAVELVRVEEKNAALQKSNFEFRAKFDNLKEQLFRLGMLEKRCLELEDQVTDAKDELEIEKHLVATLEKSQGRSIHELREQMFQEKLTRVDVAAQQAEMIAMQKEIDRLQKMLENQSAKTANASSNLEDVLAFRDEIKNLAVTLAVETAQQEGEKSPIRQLTQNNKDDKSLAGQINQHLTSQPAIKKNSRKKNTTKPVP